MLITMVMAPFSLLIIALTELNGKKLDYLPAAFETKRLTEPASRSMFAIKLNTYLIFNYFICDLKNASAAFPSTPFFATCASTWTSIFDVTCL